MRQIVYEFLPEFQKDFKKLAKRWRTLSQDFELVKKGTIEFFHLQSGNNQSIFPIPGFCSDSISICKIKKFACRSLKGKGNKTGIRVTYGYFPSELRVVFIEIYYKGDQENEDKRRIQQFLNSITS